MATQTASISIGFTRSGVSKKQGAAVAVLQCGTLEAANQYAGGSGLLSRTRNKYKLPSSRVPFGDVQPDGSVVVRKDWYDVLNYVFNTQLGGITGPTLGDITETVSSSSAAAIDAQNAVSVVAQTVNANASTLAATVQVSQASALPGAAQIEPPVYTTKGVQR
jgi:hypothetical protein